MKSPRKGITDWVKSSRPMRQADQTAADAAPTRNLKTNGTIDPQALNIRPKGKKR